MERLRYFNCFGKVFELERSWAKCLELENRAALLLARLQGRSGWELEPRLEADLRGFLGGLSREMRSVTPRPPARPLGLVPEIAVTDREVQR